MSTFNRNVPCVSSVEVSPVRGPATAPPPVVRLTSFIGNADHGGIFAVIHKTLNEAAGWPGLRI